MSESGSEPNKPPSQPNEPRNYKLEKMGNDDLMAIFGGVIPPAVSKLPEPPPLSSVFPAAKAPETPAPVEHVSKLPEPPPLSSVFPSAKLSEPPSPTLAGPVVESPQTPAPAAPVESVAKSPEPPPFASVVSAVPTPEPPETLPAEPVVPSPEPLLSVPMEPIAKAPEPLAAVPLEPIAPSPEPLMPVPAEPVAKAPEPPVSVPVEPSALFPKLPPLESVAAPSAPKPEPEMVKPVMLNPMDFKLDAASESLDASQELVSDAGMHPDIQVPPVKTQGSEVGGVSVPGAEPTLPSVPPQEVLFPSQGPSPQLPPMGSVLPPIDPTKQPDGLIPILGKKPFDMPPGLKPIGFSAGSMYPKGPIMGTDPLGLFNPEAALKPLPPTGPVTEPVPVKPFALTPENAPPLMPQAPGPLVLGMKPEGPLAAVSGPEATSLPKGQDRPFEGPPTPPAPKMEEPVLGMPGSGLGHIAMEPPKTKEDPFKLFMESHPIPSDATVTGPQPALDLSHLGGPGVEEKKVIDDPLHLFDKPGVPTSPGGPLSGLPQVEAPRDMPGVPKAASNVDDATWKSGLVKPLFPARPIAVSPASYKSASPASGKGGLTRARSFLHLMLGPLVAKTRVPALVWELLMVLVVLGVLTAVGLSFRKPSYQLADHLAALSPTRIEVRDVVELDITSYLDLESKIQKMGFVPLTRLLVPEIPSPNFFSVYLNNATKTYGILLKVPGSNMPRLSFVNVLSNGTWLSTNAWASKDQQLERLDSESAPKEEPAALWAHHQKRLDQALQTGLSVPPVNEWRFICTLSDHLRWYMAKQDIPAYKATFEDWF